MSRKHNCKHPSRGQSSYGKKVEREGMSRLSDVRLSDGKMSNGVKR